MVAALYPAPDPGVSWNLSPKISRNVGRGVVPGAVAVGKVMGTPLRSSNLQGDLQLYIFYFSDELSVW